MATDFTSLYRQRLRAMSPFAGQTARLADSFGLNMPEGPSVQPPVLPDFYAQLGWPRPHQPQPVASTEPPPMTPEEESGLLNRSMGALQYVGETLDKPGSAVRGAISGLSGGPWGGGLLNLIPFSDTLGITKPEERVSGRQLLEKAGVLGENTPGLDWGDVAGFGTEVATDPLLFLKVGALTKLGAAKAAERSAKALEASQDIGKAIPYMKGAVKSTADLPAFTSTPKSLAEQLASGERALFGFGMPHIPFTKGVPNKGYSLTSDIIPGTGKLAAKVLEWGAYKEPIVPFIRGMFDYRAAGRLGGTDQLIRDQAFLEHAKLMNAVENIAPAFRQESESLAKTFEDIAQHFNANGDARAFNDFSRAMTETWGKIPEGQAILDEMTTRLGAGTGANLAGVVADPNALASRFFDFFDTLRSTENDLYLRYKDLGGKGGILSDKFASHFGRRANAAVERVQEAQGGTSGGRQFAFWMHRSEDLRDMPGGSEAINKALRSGWFRKDADIADLTAAANSLGIPLPAKVTKAGLRESLLREGIIRPSLDDALAKGVIDQATWDEMLNPLTGAFTYQGRQAAAGFKRPVANRARRTAEYFRRLPDEIHEQGLFDKAVVQDWFGYMHSLTGKIATLETTHSFLSQADVVTKGGAGESLVTAWDRAGFERSGLKTWAMRQYPNDVGNSAQDLDKFVKELTIPAPAADALKAFGESMKPQVQEAYLNTFDKITSVYKQLWTMPWPAFHTRNLAGSTFNAWAQQKVPLWKLLSGEKTVSEHIRTNGAKSASFLQEGLENGALNGGPLAEILSPEKAAERFKVGKGILGGSLDWVTKPVHAALHPIETLGHPVRTTRRFFKTWGEASQNAYNYVETVTRGGYYQALRESGFSPAEAKHLVLESQFDYGKLSPFERKVAKRAVPFYGWLRNNVPYQLSNLIERPGGRAAQATRAYKDFSAAGQEQGYAPSFLREGLAVSTGGPPEATSFIRQAGLPLEDLNKVVMNASGLPEWGRTAEKLASNLNPMFLAPIETMAGKQFWTGRSIKDLQSPTEKYLPMSVAGGAPVPAIDWALHYSPLSTGVSNVLSLIDERKTPLQKAGNLLSGFKTATYDVNKWKLIDLKDAMEQQLSENPIVRDMTVQLVPPRYQALPQATEAKAAIRKTQQLARALGAMKKRRLQEQAAKEK